MQSWHTTYLGLRELPREISTFELQSFFTYSGAERELINAHKLGLALHIGFLRLSGREAQQKCHSTEVKVSISLRSRPFRRDDFR